MEPKLFSRGAKKSPFAYLMSRFTLFSINLVVSELGNLVLQFSNGLLTKKRLPKRSPNPDSITTI